MGAEAGPRAVRIWNGSVAPEDPADVPRLGVVVADRKQQHVAARHGERRDLQVDQLGVEPGLTGLGLVDDPRPGAGSQLRIVDDLLVDRRDIGIGIEREQVRSVAAHRRGRDEQAVLERPDERKRPAVPGRESMGSADRAPRGHPSRETEST